MRPVRVVVDLAGVARRPPVRYGRALAVLVLVAAVAAVWALRR
jgi:hypothetical protein